MERRCGQNAVAWNETYDPRSRHLDPRSRHIDPRSQHLDPRSRHLDPRSVYTSILDPRSSISTPRPSISKPRSSISLHFDPRCLHFHPRSLGGETVWESKLDKKIIGPAAQGHHPQIVQEGGGRGTILGEHSVITSPCPNLFLFIYCCNI